MRPPGLPAPTPWLLWYRLTQLDLAVARLAEGLAGSLAPAPPPSDGDRSKAYV